LKVCIFTNYFYPEPFKVNDIAFEFAQKGYEITVITAIPNYPQGKFYDGYSLFKRRKEILNNVRIIRLPIIPRGKGKKIELVFNYISYFISALFFTFFHSYTNKYDVAFVHLVSPFFIGLPAVLLKRRQHIPLVFWVLDLWPESLSAAGGINNGFILNSQLKFVKFVYDNCDKILIGSHGFRKSICEKGMYDDKLIYFPNWAESVKSERDFSEYQQLKFFQDSAENDFIILFAGNIGEAQNLDFIIDVAADMKTVIEIKFVFLGYGRQKKHLEDRVEKLGLSRSVFFLGQYPLDSMPVFMKRADVLLVSLKDESIFSLTVPSKIQFYMAQGKPILAVLNGDGADLVKEAQCGIAVPVNDPTTLKTAIYDLYEMLKEKMVEMGLNGKKYYQKYFMKEQRMDQLDQLFKNIIESTSVS
jgi:glycosyltransferase involved in cell wall biosynthesis